MKATCVQAGNAVLYPPPDITDYDLYQSENIPEDREGDRRYLHALAMPYINQIPLVSSILAFSRQRFSRQFTREVHTFIEWRNTRALALEILDHFRMHIHCIYICVERDYSPGMRELLSSLQTCYVFGTEKVHLCYSLINSCLDGHIHTLRMMKKRLEIFVELEVEAEEYVQGPLRDIHHEMQRLLNVFDEGEAVLCDTPRVVLRLRKYWDTLREHMQKWHTLSVMVYRFLQKMDHKESEVRALQAIQAKQFIWEGEEGRQIAANMYALEDKICATRGILPADRDSKYAIQKLFSSIRHSLAKLHTIDDTRERTQLMRAVKSREWIPEFTEEERKHPSFEIVLKAYRNVEHQMRGLAEAIEEGPRGYREWQAQVAALEANWH